MQQTHAAHRPSQGRSPERWWCNEHTMVQPSPKSRCNDSSTSQRLPKRCAALSWIHSARHVASDASQTAQKKLPVRTRAMPYKRNHCNTPSQSEQCSRGVTACLPLLYCVVHTRRRTMQRTPYNAYSVRHTPGMCHATHSADSLQGAAQHARAITTCTCLSDAMRCAAAAGDRLAAPNADRANPLLARAQPLPRRTCVCHVFSTAGLTRATLQQDCRVHCGLGTRLKRSYCLSTVDGACG